MTMQRFLFANTPGSVTFFIFFAFLNIQCKSRYFSQNESLKEPDTKSKLWFVYLADDDFAYRLECPDALPQGNIGLPADCKTKFKLPLADFEQQLTASAGMNAQLVAATIQKLASNAFYQATDFPFNQSALAVRTLLQGIPAPQTTSGQQATAQSTFGVGSSQGNQNQGGASVVGWTPSNPPSTNMNIAKNEVLSAMRQIESTFWTKPVTEKIRQECLNNDVPEWSDIMIHYYCQLANQRVCFSTKAKEGNRNTVDYHSAFEKCESDQEFKWVIDNQKDMFKYIMMTVKYIDAFNQSQQDQVINEFYGVTVTGDCSKRPLRKNMRDPNQPCGDFKASPPNTASSAGSAATNSPTTTGTTQSSTASNTTGSSSRSTATGTQTTVIAAIDSPSKAKPLPAFGYLWVETPASFSDCKSVCKAYGGFAEGAQKYESNSATCSSLVSTFLGQTATLEYEGWGPCESGCMFDFDKKLAYSCKKSLPNGGRINLDWSRLCPCQEE